MASKLCNHFNDTGTLQRWKGEDATTSRAVRELSKIMLCHHHPQRATFMQDPWLYVFIKDASSTVVEIVNKYCLLIALIVMCESCIHLLVFIKLELLCNRSFFLFPNYLLVWGSPFSQTTITYSVPRINTILEAVPKRPLLARQHLGEAYGMGASGSSAVNATETRTVGSEQQVLNDIRL